MQGSIFFPLSTERSAVYLLGPRFVSNGPIVAERVQFPNTYCPAGVDPLALPAPAGGLGGDAGLCDHALYNRTQPFRCRGCPLGSAVVIREW